MIALLYRTILFICCWSTTSLYAADTEATYQDSEDPCALHSTASDCQGKATKRFDIARFNANKRGSTWKFTENGVTTTQRFSDVKGGDEALVMYYEETYSGNNSKYLSCRNYNLHGILLAEGKVFYRDLVGIWTTYDSQGQFKGTRDFDMLLGGYPPNPPNSVREDYDLDQGRFELSVEALAQVMQKKFKINIFDIHVIAEVTRIQVPEPFYIVYPNPSVAPGTDETQLVPEKYGYFAYLIDGKTGEILYHAWWYPNIPEGWAWSVNLRINTGFYEQYYREKHHQEPSIRWPFKAPQLPTRVLTEEEKKIEEQKEILRRILR